MFHPLHYPIIVIIITIGDLVILVPTSYRDLIREGNRHVVSLLSHTGVMRSPINDLEVEDTQ